MQNGLYPIYLNLNQTINIDPLYEFTNWKSVINSEADFNYLIDNELKKVFSQNKNIKIGKKYSEQYFTKLKPISIYRSLAL